MIAHTDTSHTDTSRPEVGSRWRHVARGSTYVILHRATMQSAGAHDMASVVVYQDSGGGRVWVRREAEFVDGRFEPVGCAIVPGRSGDWPEDSGHENGNYSNICGRCERVFTGHKRRPLCRECAEGEDKP